MICDSSALYSSNKCIYKCTSPSCVELIAAVALDIRSYAIVYSDHVQKHVIVRARPLNER